MTEEQKQRKREYNKKWREDNKEKIRETSKKWRENNKEKVRDTSKKQYRDNKEKLREQVKKWRENNKEKIRETHRKWKQDNKEKVRENYKEWSKSKRNSNPLFKLRGNIRASIARAMTRKGHRKTSKTTDILGIDFVSFKQYLEKQFEPWMNWDNYGKYKRDTFNYGWDIDHIIPLSSVITEEEIIKLNHYTNLRPLCSKINRDVKKARHP